MADPVAVPADVRGEIDTGLDDPEIQFQIDEAAFDNAQVNDAAAMDTPLRRRIEQKLAALKILEGPDREESQKALGSGSKSYRGNAIARLQRELSALDPSGDLVVSQAPQADFEAF